MRSLQVISSAFCSFFNSKLLRFYAFVFFFHSLNYYFGVFFSAVNKVTDVLKANDIRNSLVFSNVIRLIRIRIFHLVNGTGIASSNGSNKLYEKYAFCWQTIGNPAQCATPKSNISIINSWYNLKQGKHREPSVFMTKITCIVYKKGVEIIQIR